LLTERCDDLSGDSAAFLGQKDLPLQRFCRVPHARRGLNALLPAAKFEVYPGACQVVGQTMPVHPQNLIHPGI
jgi:hypothetical protein